MCKGQAQLLSNEYVPVESKVQQGEINRAFCILDLKLAASEGDVDITSNDLLYNIIS